MHREELELELMELILQLKAPPGLKKHENPRYTE